MHEGKAAVELAARLASAPKDVVMLSVQLQALNQGVWSPNNRLAHSGPIIAAKSETEARQLARQLKKGLRLG